MTARYVDVCTGTRWIKTTTGPMRPCPTCNPYLAHVYTDPAAWQSWHRGRPVPAPDKVPAHLRPPDFPCRLRTDLPAPPHVGAQAAIDAYTNECLRLGREPNESTLAGLFRMVDR